MTETTRPPTAMRAVLRLTAFDWGWALVWMLVTAILPAPRIWEQVAFTLVTGVFIAVRRPWPLISAAGLTAILAVQVLTMPYLTLTTIVGALAAGYGATRHAPRPWRWLIVGGLIVGNAAGVLYLTGAPRLESLPLLGWGVGLVLLFALIGEVRRRSVDDVARRLDQAALQRRLEVEEVEKAALEQRAFIARELHDIVTHALGSIAAQADGGRYGGATNPEVALAALTTIGGISRDSMAQMRAVMDVLRDDTTRPFTPLVGVADLPRLVEEVAASGVPVSFTEAGTPPDRLRADLSLTLYRVVQESLTNVRGHAGPGARAEVRLAWGDAEATLTVTDSGGAAHLVLPEPGRRGLGLRGMRERVAPFGGTVEAGPHGGGWRVRAVLPLDVPAKEKP